MKHLRLLLLAALPLAAFAVPSDPVGVLRLKLRGHSDTTVSLPLHRPPLLTATLTARTHDQLTLDATVPSLPVGGAYALVATGALEGAVLPITNANGSGITIDAGSYDLTGLTMNADLVAVIPYWTLDALFPAGKGVNASVNPLSPRTEILLFSNTRPGKNHAASAIYYYYSGTALLGSGWYKVGTPGALAGSTQLPPYGHFIVRHNVSTETELLLPGHVQMSGYRLPIATLSTTEEQDNRVSWPVPLPTTLANANLIGSGAFRATTNPLSPTDQLLRFDNTIVGKNKAAASIYYYYQGAALHGPGWYKMGSTARADQDALLPGEALVIRKKATDPVAVHAWDGVPSYLQ